MAHTNYRHEDGGAVCGPRSRRHTGLTAHSDRRNLPWQTWGALSHPSQGAAGSILQKCLRRPKKHLPELQPPLSLLIGIFPPLPTGRWLGGEGDPQKRPLNLDASMDHLHRHPAEVPAHSPGLGAPKHSYSRLQATAAVAHQRRSRHSLASLLQKPHCLLSSRK